MPAVTTADNESTYGMNEVVNEWAAEFNINDPIALEHLKRRLKPLTQE